MNSKTSIYIYTNNPSLTALKEITAGIEEEGVLYEIFQQSESDLDALTYHASCESLLGCGVGITGEKAKIQLSSLAMGSEISHVNDFDKKEYRKLGANAARLVKKKSMR